MARLRGQEKARYVAAMFDRISRRYDLLNTVMSGGRHHSWRRRAADLAIQDGQGEALDVATGTGDFALELARRPGVTRVIGLDFAPQMLSLARQKAARHGLSQRVHWALGDAHALPFPDGRFLCVTSGFGLRNFSEAEAALGEMARVVRPGGRVVILDIVPFQGRGVLHRLSRLYLRKVIPRLGALLSGDREGYAYLPESVDSYLNPQELSQMMEGLGLQRVKHQVMGSGMVALHVGEKPAEAAQS
ncbi:MAG: bifunctional demethylmenaquinone methyltransferase/2-methoxy-6-polyprenyl-1,4-benzoquinol methylase [Dehalococcoidia bacterium]|nr:bifunctional demethylmenaquinone methyltransferase/2-methoxy-6-polyprenyl-1,4-benzoquinol methylase [Dehalococcoidia bacterium]